MGAKKRKMERNRISRGSAEARRSSDGRVSSVVGNPNLFTFGAFCQGMLGPNNFLPTHGFSTKPLNVIHF